MCSPVQTPPILTPRNTLSRLQGGSSTIPTLPSIHVRNTSGGYPCFLPMSLYSKAMPNPSWIPVNFYCEPCDRAGASVSCWCRERPSGGISVLSTQASQSASVVWPAEGFCTFFTGNLCLLPALPHRPVCECWTSSSLDSQVTPLSQTQNLTESPQGSSQDLVCPLKDSGLFLVFLPASDSDLRVETERQEVRAHSGMRGTLQRASHSL